MITFEINGEKLELSPTWKASMDYDGLVGSPLDHSMRIMRGEMPLKSADVASIIWIGLKHGGSDVSRDDVAEACFKNMIKAMSVAVSFLMALVNGGDDVEVSVEEGEKKQEA